MGQVLHADRQQHVVLSDPFLHLPQLTFLHLPQLTVLHDLLQLLQHLQRHAVEVEQHLVPFFSHHHLRDQPLAVSI